MADKTLINLATGLEDAERVLVAFLIGGAALEAGRPTAMFLTKDAVRLALPGHAVGVACEGCPPLERLFQQYAENGGEALTCPICLNTRGLEGANSWRTHASPAPPLCGSGSARTPPPCSATDRSETSRPDLFRLAQSQGFDMA